MAWPALLPGCIQVEGLHAPVRLASSGEPDSYRLVVGEPEEEPAEGSAVVEDTKLDDPHISDAEGADAGAEDRAVAAPTSKGAPAPGSLPVAVAVLGLAAGMRSRQRG